MDAIRKGIAEGTDTSVCLKNYRADGTPFWNQFFVAPLRDLNHNVVYYVGAQCVIDKPIDEKEVRLFGPSAMRMLRTALVEMIPLGSRRLLFLPPLP